MPSLQVMTGLLTGQTIAIEQDGVTIGRAPDNRLVVDDPAVSSHHCAVLSESGKCRVKDLDSTNGTYVNGKRVDEWALRANDTISVGAVELLFQGEEADADLPEDAPAGLARAAAPTPSAEPSAPAEGPRQTRATAPPPRTATLQTVGPSPFTARRNRKWIWVGVIAVVAALVITLLAWFIVSVANS